MSEKPASVRLLPLFTPRWILRIAEVHPRLFCVGFCGLFVEGIITVKFQYRLICYLRFQYKIFWRQFLINLDERFVPVVFLFLVALRTKSDQVLKAVRAVTTSGNDVMSLQVSFLFFAQPTLSVVAYKAFYTTFIPVRRIGRVLRITWPVMRELRVQIGITVTIE